MSKIKGKLNAIQQVQGKLNYGVGGTGVSLKQVLEAINTSNGIKNNKTNSSIDISGEDLETEAMTNLEIENILKM